MHLVVGLGNPGTQYLLTRHNIGFLACDYFAEFLSDGKSVNWQKDHKAFFTKIGSGDEAVVIAKPQTFMNLSGESVQKIMQFYKIPLENVVVVHDDIDQPFGQMRFHKNRGHGGHNGIKSITENLSTMDYVRLKLEVGRPPHPEMNVADYVLQKFSEDEQKVLPDFLNDSCEALDLLLTSGLNKATTQFNNYSVFKK